MQSYNLAEKHSANCFLNSLFREYSDFIFDKKSSSFVIALKDHGQLILPVKYFSTIGRHQYDEVFFYTKNKAIEKEEIGFKELVDVLLIHLSSVYKTNSEQLNIFKARINESLQNIESSLELRLSDLSELYLASAIQFEDAEQALLIGHTFHPHPKNRDGFSSEDFIDYSPESKGKFNLEWFLVKPEILKIQISKNFDHPYFMQDLFLQDGHTEVLEGYVPFPVHPWQKKNILKNRTVQNYIDQGLLIDFTSPKKAEKKWTATSSLRSIYNSASPYMLKFSLSVRLTNSVRHLLPWEVVRGLQVMDVFSTKLGKEFLTKYPSFNIVFEPAYMALCDLDKKILNDTIVAVRLNPFREEESSQKIVLATLAQDAPGNGRSLIGHYLQNLNATQSLDMKLAAIKWFKCYLEVAVKPILMAQANYGVMLGAHQQNLILEIKNNLPYGSYFRDCQGTGYSKNGFELFSKDVELMTHDNGNVLDEKTGNYLFSYYLIINSTFNVLSVLARESGLAETELLIKLREELIAWKSEGVADSSCFDYLIDGEFLMQKGNFLCSFVNMNENTTDNPVGIYNPIPNPILGRSVC